MSRELLVGVRFRYEDVRAATGNTIVLELDGEQWKRKDHRMVIELPSPVSGPIFRWQDPDSKKYQAYCGGCTDTEGLEGVASSKWYERKNEPALFTWAHNHRCVPTNQIGIRLPLV